MTALSTAMQGAQLGGKLGGGWGAAAGGILGLLAGGKAQKAQDASVWKSMTCLRACAELPIISAAPRLAVTALRCTLEFAWYVLSA